MSQEKDEYFYSPTDLITKIPGFPVILFLLASLSFSLTAQSETVPENIFHDQKVLPNVQLAGQFSHPFHDITDTSQLHINRLLWQLSIGTLAGNKNKDNMNGVPGIMLMTSYRFNKRISFGIGLGIEVMEYAAAPIYADFKLLLPVNRSYTPYLYANAGKSLSLGKPPESWGTINRYTGGIMSGAGAGVLFSSGELGWYLQAGFRYNELRTDVTHTWSNRHSTIVHYYHRLELRLGVFFN